MKKNMSIDDLAEMVQRGFEDMATKSDIEELRREMATKKELESVRQELGSKLEGINRRLDGMADYNRRIARLERLVDTLVSR